MSGYCLGSTASLSGLQFWTALVSVVARTVVIVITTTSSTTAWTVDTLIKGVTPIDNVDTGYLY